MQLKLTHLVFLLIFSGFHPFHVSVVDVEYNAQAKSIQVSQRIFSDDLEDALADFHGLESVDTVDPQDGARLDSLIGSYLKQKVFFVVNGKEKSIHYVGSELEGDARWCYYEVKGVEALKEVELSNLALMDVFDDQQNIVHFKVRGKVYSYRLDKNRNIKTFKFNQ